jgi:hypothetical protein
MSDVLVLACVTSVEFSFLCVGWVDWLRSLIAWHRFVVVPLVRVSSAGLLWNWLRMMYGLM